MSILLNSWKKRSWILRASIVLWCFIFPSYAGAQSFHGDTGIISDDGLVNYYDLEVTGLPSNVIDTSFGLLSVCLNVSHTWDDDLVIWLKSPDNTMVELTSHNGYDGDDYFHTCFVMNAASTISSGSAPFTGTFIPEGNLGDFNNGQDPNDLWQLVIVDEYAYADFGDLHDWMISFGPSASAPSPQLLFSSNLPIITINTFGQLITDPVRITAQMGIIDNGAGNENYLTDLPNNYNGFVSIEKRGSTSATFAQPSYSFETEDSAENNLDVSLLGMPAENDWILYGPYNDKSLMRDALIYRLSNDLGRYASRTKFCEVTLNNSYQGVYVLLERIKQDSARVHISPLQAGDTTGDQLTGGYILKIDKFDGEQVDYFTSHYLPCNDSTVWQHIYFQYHDPSPAEIVWQQKNYIESFVDSFEDALADPGFEDPISGYRKYADEFSFIDFALLNEISKNVDGYRWSTFFHKDKASKNGKITMGPVWDFNLAFGNADYYNGAYTDGWQWDFPCPFEDGGLNPFWWHQLLQDPVYNANLQCRWKELRSSAFSLDHLDALIDSFATLLDTAQQRHFQKYPILGTYVWPNAYYPPTYAEEIDTLKNWIAARVAWMDEQLQGSCFATVYQPVNSETGEFQIYPNPASRNGLLQLSLFSARDAMCEIFISDIMGRKIATLYQENLPAGSHQLELPIGSLSLNAGSYLITIEKDHAVKTFQIFLF
jgi:subtilisin-like proprotein convertase family protein